MHELQGKLLARAVEIAGGLDKLSLQLGVEEWRLKLWLESKATLPDRLSVELVDLVLEDDIRRAAQDRRFKPRTNPSSRTASR
jgi:hypothetical protein